MCVCVQVCVRVCACPAVNADTATLSTGHRSRQHLREIEKERCVCGGKMLLYEKVGSGERRQEEGVSVYSHQRAPNRAVQ